MEKLDVTADGETAFVSSGHRAFQLRGFPAENKGHPSEMSVSREVA